MNVLIIELHFEMHILHFIFIQYFTKHFCWLYRGFFIDYIMYV